MVGCVGSGSFRSCRSAHGASRTFINPRHLIDGGASRIKVSLGRFRNAKIAQSQNFSASVDQLHA